MYFPNIRGKCPNWTLLSPVTIIYLRQPLNNTYLILYFSIWAVSGVIQFGIETEEAQDSNVTADTVHSETPQYSEEVGPVKKGASMMTMSSADTGYRSAERRKRVKSETAASILAAGADSAARYVNSRRKSSGFSNGGFDRCVNKLHYV